MLPQIDWAQTPRKKQEILKRCCDTLKNIFQCSDEITNFGLSLPLDKCLEEPQRVREALMSCLTEIIRISRTDFFLPVDAVADLFAITLPKFAKNDPSAALSILRVLQWNQFPQLLRTLPEPQQTARNWLKMCAELSTGTNNIVNAIPEICLPAADICPISQTLELLEKFQDLFLAIYRSMPFFTCRIFGFFTRDPGGASGGFPATTQRNAGGSLSTTLRPISSTGFRLIGPNVSRDILPDELRDPLREAEFFWRLAELDPALLTGYKMPILEDPNPLIRIYAVKAYAIIDPNSPAWIRRHSDSDANVRREWARAAIKQKFHGKNSVLYGDPDPEVRAIAYSVPPLPEAKLALLKLLKLSDMKIAWDAFLAYGQLADGVTDLEVLVRWIAKHPERAYDAVAALRPALDRNLEFLLFIKNPTSERAFTWVLSHTLKFYNAITAYTSNTQTYKARKATTAWLDAKAGVWEELGPGPLELGESPTNFRRNAIPLLEAHWLAQHASAGNLFCQELLTVMAEKVPLLVHPVVPQLTESTPLYMMAVAARVSRKIPLEIVNPTTTILRDICLESKDRTPEAAEILMNCCSTLFKVLAPEIVSRAIECPTKNAMGAVVHASKVIDTHPMLKRSSLLTYVAPVYVQVVPAHQLENWLGTMTDSGVSTNTVSMVLIELVKRPSIATECFAHFARPLTDSVAMELARYIRNGQVTPRVIPLLLYSDTYSKAIKHISPVDDVHGIFARLVYYMARTGVDVTVLERFLECFATPENISTLEFSSSRLKHFKLNDSLVSTDLYVISELAQLTLTRYRQNQGWSQQPIQKPGFPLDSFTPLSVVARSRVMRTTYLDKNKLEDLYNQSSQRAKRPRKTGPAPSTNP